MASRKSQQTTIALLITAVILLAALSAYLWYDRAQLSKANNQKQEEIEEVERIQAELEIQYEEALLSLDEMKTDNAELNAFIDKQKAELASQKKKINNLIWTERKLNEARTEIAKITEQANQYVSEIQTLKDQNASLNAKNKKLKEDKTLLIDNLNVAKEANVQLETTKNNLIDEKTKLQEVKSKLEAKVNIASVIEVANVQAQGIKIKSSGKEVVRKGAKQVDKMRVCFDTEANLVASGGQEVFYVRIIDPLGQTMALESAGSGVFTNNQDGQSIRYSKKGVLNYNQKEVTACVDWKPGIAFTKGIYEIEVYNKGYLSGKGNVKFR